MIEDEDKLATAASRGARAENLLSDGLLTEAFKTLENTYTAAWRTTMIEDVSGREKIFLAINIIGKVQSHLVNVVNNGKVAAAELRALAETAERKPRWEDI